jgi:hypothetical protein
MSNFAAQALNYCATNPATCYSVGAGTVAAFRKRKRQITDYFSRSKMPRRNPGNLRGSTRGGSFTGLRQAIDHVTRNSYRKRCRGYPGARKKNRIVNTLYPPFKIVTQTFPEQVSSKEGKQCCIEQYLFSTKDLLEFHYQAMANWEKTQVLVPGSAAYASPYVYKDNSAVQNYCILQGLSGVIKIANALPTVCKLTIYEVVNRRAPPANYQTIGTGDATGTTKYGLGGRWTGVDDANGLWADSTNTNYVGQTVTGYSSAFSNYTADRYQKPSDIGATPYVPTVGKYYSIKKIRTLELGGGAVHSEYIKMDLNFKIDYSTLKYDNAGGKLQQEHITRGFIIVFHGQIGHDSTLTKAGVTHLPSAINVAFDYTVRLSAMMGTPHTKFMRNSISTSDGLAPTGGAFTAHGATTEAYVSGGAIATENFINPYTDASTNVPVLL